MPEGLDPVHARELDVHHHQVGRGLPGQPDPLLRGLRLHGPVTLDLEDVAQQLPALLVVLDDQDQLSAHGLTGRVKVNVDPLPTSLFTQIVPPCSSTNFLARVNPRPVPSRFWL